MSLSERVLKQVERFPRLYSRMYISACSPLVYRPIARWKRAGRPVPPPNSFKRQTIRSYAKKYGARILVETGTYLGDTVVALRYSFDKIHSIEVNPEFYSKARARFVGVDKVDLILGDSGVEVAHLVDSLDQTALFYLDGHLQHGTTATSADASPALMELASILNAKQKSHVILIDDARCFEDPLTGYPSMQDVQALVARTRPDLKLTVEDDLIRIEPTD
jgi:hypothetical protein